MNRREAILRGAALLSAAGGAGCNGLSSGGDPPTGTRTPEPSGGAGGTESPAQTETEPPPSVRASDMPRVRHDIPFATVRHATDDLGMDPTGSAPIDDQLARTLDRGDVLVEFPPGSYYFAREHRRDRVDNWGIRGLGSDPSAVRFHTTPGEGRHLVRTDGGRGQLVENLTFDYSEADAGSTGVVLRAADGIQIRDVAFVGRNPAVGDGSRLNLVPMATAPGGRAVVDGLVRTGLTDIVSHGHLDGTSNDSCLWAGDRHVGELVVRNAHVENSGTNAIYASRTPGSVRILDSTFRNNNQASLRVGGRGTLVRDCSFEIDTDRAPRGVRGDFINPHSILWETGGLGLSGGRIRDCQFRCLSAPSRTKAAVWVDGSAGAFSLRDSSFAIDAPGVQALRIDDPTDPRLGAEAAKPWRASVRDVRVVGSGRGKPVIELTGRSDSTFDGLTLEWATPRPGVLLTDAEGVTFRDSTIATGGQPVLTSNATCLASGWTSIESCADT